MADVPPTPDSDGDDAARTAAHPAAPASAHARTRRTWPQRLTVAGLVLASVVSFAAAGALAAGQWIVSSRNLVVLDRQEPATASRQGPGIIVTPDGVDRDGDGAPDPPSGSPDPPEPTTPPTFPPAEPQAKNFLITGADNNACIDPDSRFAPAFGDRDAFGERSDTIMVWRVNPGTRQVAVLSFPRDLYVDISGGGRGRINSAYRRDDPERLRATILEEFGVPTDHYIQVDFCAFKRLVDAVGGVEVPFEYPARDLNSGLFVPEVGCYNFEGDHALAYVRSRYYDYEDPPGSGNWRRDGTSDFGRIARQQDFLRRTVATVLRRGAYTPSVVTALIETNREYLTVDSDLTLSRMLEFAGVLQSLDPASIASYRIESRTERISGQSVEIPRIGGENMQAILAIFRGEATLADAPEQAFDESGTDEPLRPGASTTTTSPDPATTPATTPPPTTVDPSVPVVTAVENPAGVSPSREISC